MTTGLMERPSTTIAAPIVTPDQLDLIRRTVAKDATPDELKLYLYDCARQGVHPLDKLIHFTKRSGKYTPVTSIDFMRIRAADTEEYAGSDAALYAGTDGIWSSLWSGTEPPFAALVTVWRLVQGQRCKFEAVARWSEYKPDQDFMWRKMPTTMLAKCAEALALRKGFPRQLAGLYAKEEMDQTDASSSGTLGGAPTVTAQPFDPRNTAVPMDQAGYVDAETGEELAAPPAGYHYVTNYSFKNGWHEADLVKWDTQGGPLHVSTKLKIGELLNQAANFHVPASCDVTMKKQTKGEAYVNKVTLLKVAAPSVDPGITDPIDVSEIPF